jgi:hypothetical protein
VHVYELRECVNVSVVCASVYECVIMKNKRESSQVHVQSYQDVHMYVQMHMWIVHIRSIEGQILYGCICLYRIEMRLTGIHRYVNT